MKSLFPLTYAAAFAAFLVLPFNAEITGSLSFVASLAMVLGADYGRRLNSLSVATAARPATRERLRLAA
jgi:hypothetical protein